MFELALKEFVSNRLSEFSQMRFLIQVFVGGKSEKSNDLQNVHVLGLSLSTRLSS